MEAKIQFHSSWLEQPRAVTLVAHGLNLAPARMGAWIEVLQGLGSHVVQLALSGHLPTDLDAFRRVTREIWVKDIDDTYQEARLRAKSGNLPIFAFGYSIGAALIQDWMNSSSHSNPIDRQVLLSPSIAVRATSEFARVFGFLGAYKPEWLIPSLSYGSYHAHRATPAAGYRALFETIDGLHETKMAKSNIPTLVMIDPRDELVSPGKTRELIQNFGLSNWRMEEIRTQSSMPIPYRHLVVDPTSTGAAPWSQMIESIRLHLFKE